MPDTLCFTLTLTCTCTKYTCRLLLPVGDGTKTGTSGTVYKPTSKIMQKIEEKKSKEEGKSLLSTASGVNSKPLVYS